MNVLVLGPPLAGVTSLVAALRARLADLAVVEWAELGPGDTTDVVVFATSAAAPMSGCDLRLFETVADRSDAIVAVVTKADVHRLWRDALEANRTAVSRSVPWVGVAAAPQIGPPVLADLVAAIRAELQRGRRSRPRATAARHAAQRLHIAQTRLELARRARRCSAELHADLHRVAATVSARSVAGFEDRMHRSTAEAIDDFEAVIAERVPGLVVPAPAELPPLSPRAGFGPQDRLAAVLGTGFGVGVALTLGRVAAEVMPAATPTTLPVCGAVGLGLTGWVVRTRRLVAARVAATRRAGEAATVLRTALDDRVLTVESALLAAHLDQLGLPSSDAGP